MGLGLYFADFELRVTPCCPHAMPILPDVCIPIQKSKSTKYIPSPRNQYTYGKDVPSIIHGRRSLRRLLFVDKFPRYSAAWWAGILPCWTTGTSNFDGEVTVHPVSWMIISTARHSPSKKTALGDRGVQCAVAVGAAECPVVSAAAVAARAGARIPLRLPRSTERVGGGLAVEPASVWRPFASSTLSACSGTKS